MIEKQRINYDPYRNPFHQVDNNILFAETIRRIST